MTTKNALIPLAFHWNTIPLGDDIIGIAQGADTTRHSWSHLEFYREIRRIYKLSKLLKLCKQGKSDEPRANIEWWI